MRKIYNYIMIAVFAFAAISCIDEIGNTDIPTAETGDEVQFGLSLPDAKTRTVYGDEANNAFPIYWVNEDKVQIFSPQCLEGRRSAEYKVAVDGSEQNFATSLTKTGAYGVQWGDEETADFYSLYPSGNYTLSEYEDEDGNVLPWAAGITINYSQNILVDGDDVKSDMEDCLMYAKTTGVTRGETVNLHYDPISTVFMVTLNVSSDSAEDFTIQSISLIAGDESIAGTFSLDIADGSFAEWGDNSSSTVTAQIYDKSTGGYYTLTKGNSVQIPLFLAPVEGLNTDGWLIRVVANNKAYSKTLEGQDIVAGEIHKVTLPNLLTEKVEEDWDVSKWMTYIPRNVYLSEISIPGSWNSLNVDSQGSTPSISTQYTNGVRAFHLDTRWKRTNQGSTIRPNYTYELGIAIGGSGNTTSGDYKYMTAGSTFKEALTEITGAVKTDEYMVLICTFAQNSAQYNGADGWTNEISSICDSFEEVYDAKHISENTLVGDVLGKVIVIINIEGEVSTVPSGSKCLFVNMPMTVSSTDFSAILSDRYDQIKKGGDDDSTTAIVSGIGLYNTHAQLTKNQDDAYTGNGQNGDRGYVPSKGQRITEINNILDWSQDNYLQTESYTHDKWIYLGLGGYYGTYNEGFLGINEGWKEDNNAHSTVASDFNSLINDRVTAMGANNVRYYPVGIVLMNYVNDYKDVVKNILTLNSNYRLQYDPSKPSDYIGGDEGGSGEGGL